MYTRVHRKEMKLKEAVRFRGLYTLLTKGKGFSLQGMINCKEVNRECMGELMENLGYFSEVSTCKLILVLTTSCIP